MMTEKNLCNSCELQEECLVAKLSGGRPMTTCKEYVQIRRETVRAKPTNAETLRNMTDEEMATWLYKHLNCRDCPCNPCVTEEDIDRAGKGIRVNPCECILLEWLRKEADDGNTE